MRRARGTHTQRMMRVTLWLAAQGGRVPSGVEIADRFEVSEATALDWRTAWLAVRPRHIDPDDEPPPCIAEKMTDIAYDIQRSAQEIDQ